MPLQVTHEKIEDVPENYRDLYTEKDGAFHLTGVGGIKTQSDIDRVTAAMNRERDEHRLTREKYSMWKDADYDEVMGKLDRVAELEIAARGNKEEMDAKLEELTEARVVSRLLPVERKSKELEDQLVSATAELQELRAASNQRTIHDEVRSVMHSAKIIQGAEPDVLLLADSVFVIDENSKEVTTRENPYGIPAGLSAEVWITEMKDKRPHWWPSNEGGNSRGSSGQGGGSNPWSDKSWNLTAQGAVYRDSGPAIAKQMAIAAGTTLGGGRPAPKK